MTVETLSKAFFLNKIKFLIENDRELMKTFPFMDHLLM